MQSQFSNIYLSFVSQQPTASQVIKDVMRQLSFEKTKLDGVARFGDVAGSGIDSFGLSHDESFGVDDLDLNLNEHEPDFGRTPKPIMEEVIIEDYVSSGEDAEYELQVSMSKVFRAKSKAERDIRGYHVLQYSMLRDYVIELQSANPNATVKIAVERNIDPSLPTMAKYWKLLDLVQKMEIYPLAYAFVEAESRAKSDLLLKNIYEAFNGKKVGGRDKLVITF
ncbi:hypothetical protein Tco_0656153 [Tanacetum coccineum]|uniref:Uncharacterized protein n=1 Tax=Tanacetum coccineum TaxID=301880 RepID=A0ABQ4X7Z9_9ASTR